MGIEVGEKLGSGQNGSTYKGFDTELARTVAVKFFHQLNAHTEEAAKQEAQVLAKLRHPAIVTVHDLRPLPHPEKDRESSALIMEFVDGRTLLDSRTDIEPHCTLAIGEAIIAAVGAFHAIGIGHGDLHPKNVMLSHDGEVKVIDPMNHERLAASAVEQELERENDVERLIVTLETLAGWNPMLARGDRDDFNVEARNAEALDEIERAWRRLCATMYFPRPADADSTGSQVGELLRKVLADEPASIETWRALIDEWSEQREKHDGRRIPPARVRVRYTPHSPKHLLERAADLPAPDQLDVLFEVNWRFTISQTPVPRDVLEHYKFILRQFEPRRDDTRSEKWLECALSVARTEREDYELDSFDEWMTDIEHFASVAGRAETVASLLNMERAQLHLMRGELDDLARLVAAMKPRGPWEVLRHAQLLAEIGEIADSIATAKRAVTSFNAEHKATESTNALEGFGLALELLQSLMAMFWHEAPVTRETLQSEMDKLPSAVDPRLQRRTFETPLMVDDYQTGPIVRPNVRLGSQRRQHRSSINGYAASQSYLRFAEVSSTPIGVPNVTFLSRQDAAFLARHADGVPYWTISVLLRDGDSRCLDSWLGHQHMATMDDPWLRWLADVTLARCSYFISRAEAVEAGVEDDVDVDLRYVLRGVSAHVGFLFDVARRLVSRMTEEERARTLALVLRALGLFQSGGAPPFTPSTASDLISDLVRSSTGEGLATILIGIIRAPIPRDNPPGLWPEPISSGLSWKLGLSGDQRRAIAESGVVEWLFDKLAVTPADGDIRRILRDRLAFCALAEIANADERERIAQILWDGDDGFPVIFSTTLSLLGCIRAPAPEGQDNKAVVRQRVINTVVPAAVEVDGSRQTTYMNRLSGVRQLFHAVSNLSSRDREGESERILWTEHEAVSLMVEFNRWLREDGKLLWGIEDGEPRHGGVFHFFLEAVEVATWMHAADGSSIVEQQLEEVRSTLRGLGVPHCLVTLPHGSGSSARGVEEAAEAIVGDLWGELEFGTIIALSAIERWVELSRRGELDAPPERLFQEAVMYALARLAPGWDWVIARLARLVEKRGAIDARSDRLLITLLTQLADAVAFNADDVWSPGGRNEVTSLPVEWRPTFALRGTQLCAAYRDASTDDRGAIVITRWAELSKDHPFKDVRDAWAAGDDARGS